MATLYVGSDQTYKTLQEAVNAATNDDTIVLKSNVTASDSISISKDLTVDLGGFTLDAKVYVKEAAAVEFKNGSMTYTNTNPSFGSAVITTGVYTDANGNIKSSGGAAALTLTNVTVKGGEAVNSRYYTDAVAYKSTGGLTITNSTIIGGTSTRNADCESIGSLSSGANAIYVYVDGSGEVKIENSTITGGYGKTEGEYTGYVSQMFSPGGTAINLSGSAAVTILNSEVTGGGSNWYNAEDGINVSNQFKGTLSIKESTVAGGTAEGKASSYGTGGVGIYTNMSTGCKEIAITDSTISGGDGGCSSNGNGIEYRNTDIKMTITNSTIEAGNGENAKGNGAALGIYNTTSTQVILDDVKLNGEGDGNTVIKYGHHGITVTGPVEVIGGTLEGSKVGDEIKGVKITVDATKLNGSQAVISGNVKDGGVQIELNAGDSGAILIEDGGVMYVTTETDVTKADKSVIYVNSAYSGEEGALVGPGRFLGVNAFADVNAAEAVAQAYATKMVIVNGTNLTYAGTTFLNANPDEGGVNNAYDNVVSSDKTYDLEVNGTFKAYQVVLNNAVTTVSATGRLLATGENFRVMGGTIAVQGTRAENAGAPEEVVIKKNPHTWGGGLEIGKDAQISAGYFKLNQKAVATFDDTVFLITAKVFEVNDAKATFDNTYLYLVSVGEEQDIQMSITNGAEVTFANNTTVLNDAAFGMHVTVGEGSKLNLNNATFALDNSQKTTTLTNNGTVTVSGASTVKIGTVTGNAIQVLDGAIVKDSTIGGGVFVAGNVTFRGDNTFAMLYDFGTLTDNYGTTAPMAWTVEAGASLTLTDKARYGLGYGDKVTINGKIAANGAAAARAALTDPSAVKSSLFMHGLVAQESKGWNCDSSFTVKNAYVTIGSNDSFGNKPGNYGGTYTFLFDNAVLDASRITFYEALSKTNFTFKDSDVKTGTFMTRDADSVFTLQNTTLISTTATNGNDEGNYNAGTLNLQNSTLQYAAPVVNESGSINIADSTLIATTITNNGSITISGTSTVKLDKIDGSGWIYMAGATIDEETSLKGANVRFASGKNIVDGSVIKDGRFQVGTGLWGVEDPKVSKDGVTVTVQNNAFIGGFDGSASPFGGWVGSQGYDGKVVAANAPRYTLNVQKSNANFGYMHVSHDGVMTITGNAAEMQKYTGVEHSYYSGYLNINGVVTFDAANALVLSTNVSVDNGSTENPGKLIIQNGANYVSYRDSSTKDVSFTISQSGIVEVNNATLDLRHGTLIKENASLSIIKNGIFKGNAVTNNGTFSFDQTAKITVGSFTNAGTINVTVSGEAAKTYMGGLVIDANAASSYGQVNVSVEGKNFEAVVNGNDLYVVDTTIYVNTAWAGLADGTDLGGGKYFNVNAFASLGSISAELSQGARQVQFTYNGTAPGLEITVTNDAAGSSLIYGFGGQTYASLGGANVHEFAPETGKTYIFDFKQGDFSFAVNEIAANKDTTVTPGTSPAPVAVDVNEFSGRKEFAFEVVESTDPDTYTEGTFELNITDLDGAAWVVLYDKETQKTVKEYVVIRDGKVTFDGLEAGKYTVAISAAGIPSEVKCNVTYNFTQDAVVVTDDTLEYANDLLYGTPVDDGFTAEDTIDWFKFSATEGGVNAINFTTTKGDFSVIAYTMNDSGKLQQCAAFWVFNEKENGVDYTRYLNVAADSEVYLRIEGYGKEVNYSMSVAPYTGA